MYLFARYKYCGGQKKKGNVNGRTMTSRFEIGIKQTRVGYPYPSLELSFLFYDLNTYISCQAEGS